MNLILTDCTSWQSNDVNGEDGLFTLQPTLEASVDILMDGVGSQNGKVAVAILQGKLQGYDPSKDITCDELRQRIIEAHIYAVEAKACTTILAMHRNQNRYNILTAGDGIIYILENGQRLGVVNTSDRVLGSGIDNCLGHHNFKLHHHTLDIKENNRFIMATDGVSDNISSDSIKKALQLPTSSQAVDYIQRQISANSVNWTRFHPDDMTCLIRYFG